MKFYSATLNKITSQICQNRGPSRNLRAHTVMNENRQTATVCFLNDNSSLTTKGGRYFKFFVLSKYKMVSTLHYSNVSTQPLWFLNFAGELSQAFRYPNVVLVSLRGLTGVPDIF